MSKNYSQKELKELSKEYFKQYTDVDKFFATTDGQFFISKNSAELHHKSAKVSIVEINKEEEEKEQTDKSDDKDKKSADFTVKEAEKVIKELDTFESIDAFTEGDERKAIEKAVLARYEELELKKESE